MFVGNLMLWHGLDDLIDIFSLVSHKLPSARLILVGDGPARSIVEKKVKELSLSRSVHITGYVPHEKIPCFLSAADVVVIPYPKLSMPLWFSPLKLYEYMAAGKAIVASRDGQIAEVIQDGFTGLLVEPGDKNNFAGRLIDLIQNPSIREFLGTNARLQAVSYHSWNQYIEHIEEIYKSVL
jgi:glycosyltransferase involved in cell wall biosynthesis